MTVKRVMGTETEYAVSLNTPDRYNPVQSPGDAPMTKTFIAILLVIASAHALPDLARLRGFAWLRDVLAQPGAQARSLAARLWLPAVLVVACTDWWPVWRWSGRCA